MKISFRILRQIQLKLQLIRESPTPIFIVIFIVVFASFTSIGSQSQILYQRSDVSTVAFGKIIYRIPNEYLPGITPFRQSNGYAAFTIEALLPDFKPAGLDRAEFNRLGWHNQFTALVEHGRQFRDPMDVVNDRLSRAHIESNIYKVLPNGCKLFPGDTTGFEELYVCSINDKILNFTCDISKGIPYPKCTILENINRETTAIVAFSRRYAPEAVDIEVKFHLLLDSFAAKYNNSPTGDK